MLKAIQTSLAALMMRDPAAAAAMGALPEKSADFGIEYGNFGYDLDQFGQELPTQANMARAFRDRQATRDRENILEPNRDSSAKIQRYGFGTSQDLTLGTAVAISATQKPKTHIRPQRVTSNAPVPGFGTLSAISVANVGCIVGGVLDLFDFSSLGQGQQLDVPTLSPSNDVEVTGAYSGLLPPGYVNGATFKATFTFKGPANMVA